MRRKPIQLLALALVALMVVVAAGCGGGSKTTTSTTTETTTTTEATTTTTAASTTTETTSTAATTTTSGTTTSAAGLGALAGSCGQLTSLGQAFATAMTGSNGDTSKIAATLKEFADKTPAEIRPAFETLADAMQKIADAMKGVNLGAGGVPDPTALAKLQALGSELDQTKLQEAEQQIQAWAAKNCHA